MKRSISFICCVSILFIVCTIQAKAENKLASNEYTEKERYGQIVCINSEASVCVIGNTLKVNDVCVEFAGNVIPPRTFPYSKSYLGSEYTGILEFHYSLYDDGKTLAYYSGTLYLQK